MEDERQVKTHIEIPMKTENGFRKTSEEIYRSMTKVLCRNGSGGQICEYKEN
jgi:hypothetical protein